MCIFPLNVWLYGWAEPCFNHFYVNMLVKYSAQTWICINPIITIKHFQLNMHEHLLCRSVSCTCHRLLCTILPKVLVAY